MKGNNIEDQCSALHSFAVLSERQPNFCHLLGHARGTDVFFELIIPNQTIVLEKVYFIKIVS